MKEIALKDSQRYKFIPSDIPPLLAGTEGFLQEELQVKQTSPLITPPQSAARVTQRLAIPPSHAKISLLPHRQGAELDARISQLEHIWGEVSIVDGEQV